MFKGERERGFVFGNRKMYSEIGLLFFFYDDFKNYGILLYCRDEEWEIKV